MILQRAILIVFGGLRSTQAYLLLEAASAYYVASALVAHFHGRAFDPQSGQWLDSEQLKAAAEEMAALGASEPASRD